MKIVDRHTLMKMPQWTAYMCVDEWGNPFGTMQFKMDTLKDHWDANIDWFYLETFATLLDPCDNSLVGGLSVPMAGIQSRDGSFCDDDRFLVLEPDDVATLKEWIDKLHATK